MEDLEFTGIWWLPADADNDVAGILRSSSEGIRLSLIGSFTDLTGLGIDERHPLILGLAKGGKVVTLVDCIQVSANLGMPGFLSKEFQVKTAFVGAHFEAETELKFHKAAIQYSHLADWVGASGFRRDIQSDAAGLKKAELTYEYPDDIVASTEGGEVRITYAFESGGDLVREATLRQEALVRVEAKAELSLDEWFSSFVSPMQNLLTLATMRANAVTDLTLFSASKTVSTSRGEKELPIDVYYSPVYKDGREGKILSPYDMLFTLADVRPQFDQVIQGWFHVAEELDSVCNLFFSLAYRPATYVENRFLPLVQAAESYHRRRMRNTVLPRNAHRERMKDILESVPHQHRGWLKSRLDYGNEPSLAERLQELVAATEDVTKPLVADPDEFVRKVKNTRNYLTHYDTGLKKKAAHGTELFRLAEVLSFMVQACFLGELGLTGEKRAKLFRRNQRYAYAVKQARLANS